MRLAGKVAVVTGTSPNIGAGIAQGLADEGARIACLDLSPENARQCAAWIKGRGGEALGRKPDECEFVETWSFNSNKCFAVFHA